MQLELRAWWDLSASLPAATWAGSIAPETQFGGKGRTVVSSRPRGRLPSACGSDCATRRLEM